MKKINLNFTKIRVVVFFIFVSVIVNHNILFTQGSIGLRDDWSTPYFPIQNQILGTRFLTSWLNGSILYRNLGEIPGIVFGIFSRIFGVGGDVISKTTIVSSMFLAGISMYYLSRYLKNNVKPSIIAGLLYMSSPIVFNAVVSGYLVFLLSYGLLPLLINQILILCNSNKNILKNIIVCSLIFRLTLVQDNFLHIFSTFIVIYVFIKIFSLRKFSLWFRMVLKIFIVYLFTILLSGHFVLPLVTQLGSTAKIISENAVNWNTYISPKILQAFILDGAGYRYYLNSIPLNYYPMFIASKYIILSLILIGIIKKKLTVISKVLCLVVVISIFLFKGLNQPFGFINSYIYQHFTFYIATFRNIQYITVLTSLSFSLLLSSFLQKYKNCYIFIITTFLVILGFFPYIPDLYSGNIQSYRLGSEYNDLLTDLSGYKADDKVLWLPASQPLSYLESKFAGNDPLLFGSPKYYVGNNPTNAMENELFKNIYLPKEYDKSRVIMKYIGIGRVVMRNDFQSKLPNFIGKSMVSWTNDNIQTSLDNMSDSLIEEKTYSDNLLLYQNKNKIPLIYLSKKTFFSEGNLNSTLNLLSEDDNYDSFISDSPENIEWFKSKNICKDALVEYVQISPTLYRINMKNVSDTLLLILSDNFNKGWKIYIKKGKQDVKILQFLPSNWFSGNHLAEENHVLINGYANGWLIDSENILKESNVDKSYKVPDDLYLEIEYQPQSYYISGLIISIFTAIILISYLVVCYKKGKSNE